MCQLSFSQSSSGSLNSSWDESQFPPLKPTSLLLALALLMGIAFSGCSNPLSGIFSKTPEIYIPAGKCAEIRKPTKVLTWSHDKDGKPIKSFYRAYAGANIGPGVPSSSVPPKESAASSASAVK